LAFQKARKKEEVRPRVNSDRIPDSSRLLSEKYLCFDMKNLQKKKKSNSMDFPEK
jgi:hypothetical protein